MQSKRLPRAALPSTMFGAAAAALLLATMLASIGGPVATTTPQPMGDLLGSFVDRLGVPDAVPAPAPSEAAAGIGGFDPTTATWQLRNGQGEPTIFTFGEAGTAPLVGDWNGSGSDTVGTYDAHSGRVVLRNENSSGTPDVTIETGVVGAVAIAGDFDGDSVSEIGLFEHAGGTLTVVAPRPGAQPRTYALSAGSNQLLAADFDGDGGDEIATFNPSSRTLAVRSGLEDGATIHRSVVQGGGSIAVAADWDGTGAATVRTFDATDQALTLGVPGQGRTVDPVAGRFGPIESGLAVEIDGAPTSLTSAVEARYLAATGASSTVPPLVGHASTSDTGTTQIATVSLGTDHLVAVSHDGWNWSIVGGAMPSVGVAAINPQPRFVTLIGTDSNNGNALPGSWTRARAARTFADSIHIYSFDPGSKNGAIVGIPRDTAMGYTGPGNVNGMQKINRTNQHDIFNGSPSTMTQVLADETGLPLEGYIQIGFGASRTGGHAGFTDLIDLDTPDLDPPLPFLVPYSVPGQCRANPGTPKAAAWDTTIDGEGALAFARERTCIPTDGDGNPIRNGNVVRTLSQGLLLKAGIEVVQAIGFDALDDLVAILVGNESDPEDGFITTDLSVAQLTAIGATLFDVDPGPMPTLTPDDIDTYGAAAYDLNAGALPNVVVEGCTGILDPASDPIDYAQFFRSQNYATFADLADGKLDQLPVYRYFSGDPDHPMSCPDLLGTVTRLSGKNRYETAAAISQAKFPAGVPVAYVATGLLFPDALSGGPIAALDNAPILLAQRDSLTGPTANELRRLRPKRIVILGGPGVISDNIATQLGSFTTGSVTRLAGKNRFETSAVISKSHFSPGLDVAYIATGRAFPDALAGGPVAALDRAPILLTEPTALPAPTRNELARLAPKSIIILGGPGAVSPAVEGELAKLTSGSVSRLAGSNRYETAKLISASAFDPGTTIVFVATGRNFPDALAGGPAAALSTSPILLVDTNSIPNPARAELTRLRPARIVILGGPGVVSTGVEAQLANYTWP